MVPSSHNSGTRCQHSASTMPRVWYEIWRYSAPLGSSGYLTHTGKPYRTKPNQRQTKPIMVPKKWIHSLRCYSELHFFENTCYMCGLHRNHFHNSTLSCRFFVCTNQAQLARSLLPIFTTQFILIVLLSFWQIDFQRKENSVAHRITFPCVIFIIYLRRYAVF